VLVFDAGAVVGGIDFDPYIGGVCEVVLEEKNRFDGIDQ